MILPSLYHFYLCLPFLPPNLSFSSSPVSLAPPSLSLPPLSLSFSPSLSPLSPVPHPSILPTLLFPQCLTHPSFCPSLSPPPSLLAPSLLLFPQSLTHPSFCPSLSLLSLPLYSFLLPLLEPLLVRGIDCPAVRVAVIRVIPEEVHPVAHDSGCAVCNIF
jgi:hypothetical protein